MISSNTVTKKQDDIAQAKQRLLSSRLFRSTNVLFNDVGIAIQN
jgi:hypothetical protein